MTLRISIIIVYMFCAPANSQNFVATIKPVHSLLQAIVGDTEQAVLLIDNNTSPHNYQLKPSDIRTLNNAEFIVYIDRSFESFMEKIALSLPKDSQLIELSHQPQIQQLGLRNFDRHKESEHAHDHHGAVDPHLWLSPENARAIVKLITANLSAIKPENAQTYQTNLEAILAKLDEMDAKLTQQLAPFSDMNFIVQHDAYHYFENHYGLESTNVIALDAAIPASIKHVRNIAQLIIENNVDCIFYEPQFSAKLVNSIAQESGIKSAQLDPLGQAIASGRNQYFELMQQLADNFEHCLTQAP